MKEIKSWQDVTVGQYQEIMSIDTESQITKFIESVAILLDCDPEDIRKMSFNEYQKLSEQMWFLSQEPESRIEKIIEIDGKKYGLIPDFNLIDAGTYIDADQFSQDPITNLHLILALVYRPVVDFVDLDDYTIQPHRPEGFERRANLFKEKLSIELVLGAVLFFSLRGMSYTEGLADYLTDEMKRMTS